MHVCSVAELREESRLGLVRGNPCLSHWEHALHNDPPHRHNFPSSDSPLELLTFPRKPCQAVSEKTSRPKKFTTFPPVRRVLLLFRGACELLGDPRGEKHFPESVYLSSRRPDQLTMEETGCHRGWSFITDWWCDLEGISHDRVFVITQSTKPKEKKIKRSLTSVGRLSNTSTYFILCFFIHANWT